MVNALASLEALGTSLPQLTSAGKERKGIDAVQSSPELERIRAIPRRDPHSIDLSAIENRVRRPEGTWSLHEEQALALHDAVLQRGVFAPLAVGAGKTLLATLLPTVLDVGPTVILTSAGLVKQAVVLMREYAAQFYVRRDVRWLSYNILSSPKQFAILDRLKPKIIIADECQAISNGDAARTKRFNAYMRRNPETIFCAMSGTVTKKSIKDFAHLIHLALKTHTPLPTVWGVLGEWAEALDVSDRPRPPGALIELMTEEHLERYLHTKDPNKVRHGRHYLRGLARRAPDAESELSAEIQRLARDVVRARIVETQGVVASTVNTCGARLILTMIEAPHCPQIDAVLKKTLTTWERPDGELLTLGLEVARVSRHIRLGGFYRWVWPENFDLEFKAQWLALRKAYRSELRDQLKGICKDGLDSPKLIEGALERGELRFESWTVWRDVKREMRARIGDYTPPSEWVWISDVIVNDAVKYVQEMNHPTILWTDTVAVGRAVAKVAGLVWYGAGKEAQTGILAEKGARSIVASIKAHGTGRNLQTYNQALVIGAPSSGAVWEQLLGRLHRQGQKSDTVEFDFYHTFENEVKTACRDAEYQESITGNQQKLLTAQRQGF